MAACRQGCVAGKAGMRVGGMRLCLVWCTAAGCAADRDSGQRSPEHHPASSPLQHPPCHDLLEQPSERKNVCRRAAGHPQQLLGCGIDGRAAACGTAQRSSRVPRMVRCWPWRSGGVLLRKMTQEGRRGCNAQQAQQASRREGGGAPGRSDPSSSMRARPTSASLAQPPLELSSTFCAAGGGPPVVRLPAA